MYSFLDVCKYIIFFHLERKLDLNVSKMARLVYLSNLLSLLRNNKQLTKEPIVKLKNVPGVREIFEHYSPTEILKHSPDYNHWKKFGQLFSPEDFLLLEEICLMTRYYDVFQLSELILDNLKDRNYEMRQEYSVIDEKILIKSAKELFPKEEKEIIDVICNYEEPNVSIKCAFVRSSGNYRLTLSVPGKEPTITTHYLNKDEAISSFRDAVCKLTAELSVNSTLDKMDAEIKSKSSVFQLVSVK